MSPHDPNYAAWFDSDAMREQIESMMGTPVWDAVLAAAGVSEAALVSADDPDALDDWPDADKDRMVRYLIWNPPPGFTIVAPPARSARLGRVIQRSSEPPGVPTPYERELQGIDPAAALRHKREREKTSRAYGQWKQKLRSERRRGNLWPSSDPHEEDFAAEIAALGADADTVNLTEVYYRLADDRGHGSELGAEAATAVWDEMFHRPPQPPPGQGDFWLVPGATARAYVRRVLARLAGEARRENPTNLIRGFVMVYGYLREEHNALAEKRPMRLLNLKRQLGAPDPAELERFLLWHTGGATTHEDLVGYILERCRYDTDTQTLFGNALISFWLHAGEIADRLVPMAKGPTYFFRFHVPLETMKAHSPDAVRGMDPRHGDDRDIFA